MEKDSRNINKYFLKKLKESMRFLHGFWRFRKEIVKVFIENIFFKNSPLHDGAMLISKKRVKAAGCILPVSHNQDIPRSLGLRHRAAMGISQSSDAMAVIVSEETGNISVAIEGKFRLRLSAEELESILTEEGFR